jgi:hypothetical protein
MAIPAPIAIATLDFMAAILGRGRPVAGDPGDAAPSSTMACMADRTLLLVDGSSYLYRAYHALPD